MTPLAQARAGWDALPNEQRLGCTENDKLFYITAFLDGVIAAKEDETARLTAKHKAMTGGSV